MPKLWSIEEEAQRLAVRFASVTNKAAFARKFKVPGGPSMLNQHITGRRPMNIAAATAYSRGFNVPLEGISPRLAAETAAANLLVGDGDAAIADAAPAREVDEAISILGAALMSLSVPTRRAIGALLSSLAEDPEAAPHIGQQVHALIESGKRRRHAA